MENGKCPIANPVLLIRKELDNWAIIFDPDSNKSVCLNPVSVFVFERLDGKHTVEDIMKELRTECSDAPEDAEDSVNGFIDDLLRRGLAGYEHDLA